MWNHEESIVSYSAEIDVPSWIEPDISPADVAAILQGGCASGAYMPAVAYSDASTTMGKHGDAVLQYIQDYLGELPKPRDDESWSGMAVFYLSVAVELWARDVVGELETLFADKED